MALVLHTDSLAEIGDIYSRVVTTSLDLARCSKSQLSRESGSGNLWGSAESACLENATSMMWLGCCYPEKTVNLVGRGLLLNSCLSRQLSISSDFTFWSHFVQNGVLKKLGQSSLLS